MQNNTINIKNKKAWHNYEILDKFVAGMELTGSEIKSIRMGKASLADSYCHLYNKELYVRMNISEYANASHFTHEPKRERKLLLNRRELYKIERSLIIKGNTIVPLRLFISKSGYAKLEIAMAKGKRQFDKRETIKKRENKIELKRIIKRNT